MHDHSASRCNPSLHMHDGLVGHEDKQMTGERRETFPCNAPDIPSGVSARSKAWVLQSNK